MTLLFSKRESTTNMTRRLFLRSASLGGLCATAGPVSAQSSPVAEFRELVSPAVEQAVADGLGYLARRQNPDGSFGTSGFQQNVAICGLCGMAMLAAGSVPGRGPYGSQLRRCVSYILLNCQQTGFIAQREANSRGPMYEHGFATLFLAETYGMSRAPGLREKLAQAVRLIVNTQNLEGGWRYEPRRNEADISVTVCQVMALRAARNGGLHVPIATIDRAIGYIKRCQNSDGGFMYMASKAGVSEFPRSAAALVALYSAGIYEGDEIDAGLDYLMRHPPMPNQQPRQRYYYYGHYYAVQAMWHAGGQRWKTWYQAVRDVMLSQQEKKEGSWFVEISPEYCTAMACLVLQMPNNYLPIFQR